MREAVVLVVSYFLGTVPVGLMVGKVSRGIDIRDYGSGNVGAANVLRTLGPGPAAVVFAGDTLKGLAAVLFAGALVQGAGRPIIVVIAGLLSIIGHSASPFLGFRGGKGVATSLGVIIGMDWLVAAIAFGLWAAIVGAFRYVSVASILASLSVPLLMHYSGALLRPRF
jgi:glycerol-3-phosphate acyltransferase PlsY